MAFRHQYVTPEGRVIDTGNGNASHSEGQGWGLMGAQAADDQETFARLLEWTTHNLRRRPNDTLHAWRYKPTDANPVADLNNATDGDLFIASALARAAIRWQRPDYAAQAARLAPRHPGPGPHGRRAHGAAARRGRVREAGLPAAQPVLLRLRPVRGPGCPGPVGRSGTRCGRTAPRLILQGRYGKWMLPPDWLRVDRADGSLSIAPGWPPRFSWDAIRVPMHLAWGGVAAEPVFAVLPPLLDGVQDGAARLGGFVHGGAGAVQRAGRYPRRGGPGDAVLRPGPRQAPCHLLWLRTIITVPAWSSCQRIAAEETAHSAA